MRFKKQIAILLSVIYLSISGGFAFNLHYCGGELESVSTLLSDAVCEEETILDKCCSEKKEFPSECCDDEQIDFNEVDDDTILNSSDDFQSINALVYNSNIIVNRRFNEVKKASLPNYTNQSNAPPLFKLYCSLIYYA